MTKRSQHWTVDVIGAGIALALTAVAYRLTIEPMENARTMLGRMLSARSDVEREARVLETQLGALRRRVEEMKAELAASSIQLQPARQVNERLVRLSRLANQHGLSVQQLTPASPVPSGRHVAVGMQLGGSCTYRGMIEFLNALRGEFPDTRVEQLKLAADTVTGNANFSLGCIWFAAPAGAALGDHDGRKLAGAPGSVSAVSNDSADTSPR